MLRHVEHVDATKRCESSANFVRGLLARSVEGVTHGADIDHADQLFMRAS